MTPPVIFIFGLGCVERALGRMMTTAKLSVRGTNRQPENFVTEHGARWNIILFRDQE